MKTSLDLAYNLLGRDSVSKGLKINKSDVFYINTIDGTKNELVNFFRVNSQSSHYYYDVSIIVNRNQISSYYCECEQFKNYHTCKHVAACLIYKGDIILGSSSRNDISNSILELFEHNDSSGIKEKVNVDIELDFSKRVPSFRLDVGMDKKYSISRESKFESFMSSVLNEEDYRFGVNFTYNPSIHYISDNDMDLLNYLFGYIKNRSSYYKYNPFELSDRELYSLFDRLVDHDFSIVGYGLIHGVVKGLPTKFSLSIDNDIYKLSIDDFDNYTFIDRRIRYCIYNRSLYVIPNSYSTLISSMINNGISSLVIDKEHVSLFRNGLLHKIKNDISISEDITDIVIAGEPNVSLYFDLARDMINCSIKFDYAGIIVDYFDTDSSVLRDDKFENGVLNDLVSYGFSIDSNKILLTDFDDVGYFISEGLGLLSKKYNIFTSKKIDSINILKESKISSNFSIGADGIMSYDFSTDNIDTSELDKIISSMKKNKKYYKLRNGNIIDLNNNDLVEFSNIISDLDISSGDLVNGSVVIPKYRALYIDSLKNRYRSINTSNSFDMFIDNFYKYKNINIDFGSDNNVLRDYQKDGVRWLYTLYKCDLGGILADEMGLGKSLQTICFIKQVISEKKDAKIMIVCPTSLVYNWKKEFDKFGSELKYVTVHDSKSKRLEVINDFDKYNIFITSYGLIRNDNDEYESKNFDVCIIDEAQAIKNYQAGMTREIKKIKALTKIALTGTPLENSVLELWSIFDFIMPGYLGNVRKFRDSYGIHDVDGESLSRLDDLNYLIKPFILRRKKVDVITDLPDKIENNIYLDLPIKQKKLYLSVLKDSEREFREILATEGMNKARFKILQLLMKLRQICIDPNILFSNYDGEVIKMEKLLEVVNNFVKDGHKILIFSSFKTVVDRVKSMFDSNNISSYMIAGDVKSKTRMDLVEKFNNDSTNCFLITLKSGGTGLNLVGADVVIHLDIWWNPQVENQATDRAHRIGQTKKVTVIKFVTRGTIEERIMELQNKKKILSDNLIEGKDNSEILSSLNEDDIRDLLSYSE
jgi:SNF2 family DNA or RNA helicase